MKRNRQRRKIGQKTRAKRREIERLPSIRNETIKTKLTWKTEISIMVIMFIISLLVGFALMAQYYEYYNRPRKVDDRHEYMV